MVTYEVLQEKRRGLGTGQFAALLMARLKRARSGLAMRPGPTLNTGLSSSLPTNGWKPSLSSQIRELDTIGACM